MEPIVTIAVRAARAAGNLLKRSQQNLDQVHWSAKGRNDFVSEADRAAELLIVETVRQSYPAHAILAEESGHTGDENADVEWIVDPLDGTTNFIHGIPHFAVSIGVKVRGKIEHAVVYDPMRDELFTASRGMGAEVNNMRVRVGKHQEIQDCLLATGFPFRNHALLPIWQQTFDALFESCSDVRRAGSAALDLAYVAAGRLDGFWEFGLSPWDTAAGGLLVKEAGGIIEDIQGKPDFLTTGNILAANPKVFKAMLQKLQPIVKKL
jgi:myo-inositol-1(or 4)-monophosphatase